MEAYTTWVRRNKDYVHSLQSLANKALIKWSVIVYHDFLCKFAVFQLAALVDLIFDTIVDNISPKFLGLTWLLPERFSNSEIGPEAVTATLGTLTAINEHIIDTAPEESHTGLAYPLSFAYGLYISALKDLGTLVEVVAEQYYGDKRWNFIAVRKLPSKKHSSSEISTLMLLYMRVTVRLALFGNCGYKMLLHGGETPDIGKILMIQVYNIKLGASLLSRFGESARMITDPLWVQRSKQQHAIMKPQNTFPNLYLVFRQTVENTEKLLEPVPLIGSLAGRVNIFDVVLLAEKIVELVVGTQTRYTYVWILKSEAASIHGSRQ
ncbi:hypothetical protein Goshw_007558 [Gossypium schwendimanii]|uniref:Peroxisomal membrane protein PEX16 n=1 Tax=Gossypium schwendimanii TaxID=34291 RepID=A0A7J9LLI9_GOSSC|nr:hypothetical protein [Gossypium schwendimanii]